MIRPKLLALEIGEQALLGQA